MIGEPDPLSRPTDGRTPARAPGKGSRVGPPLVVLLFLLGYLGLDLVTEGLKGALEVSLWFPPAGLALALPLIFGWRYAPALAVAFLLHLLLFRDGAGYPAWLLVGVPIVYAALYAGAAALLLRVVGIDPRLPGMRDVAWFVGLACLAAPLLVAAAVVPGFVAGGYLPAGSLWGNLLGFWAGDATGIAVLGTFLLVALRPVRSLWRGWQDRSSAGAVEGFRSPPRREVPEVVLQAFVLVLSLAVAFGITRGAGLDYAYLAFAPVVWVALRGGFERAVAALMVVNVGVVALVGGASDGPDPVLLQFGLTAITLVGLLFGALATQRKRAEAALAGSERRLRSVVDNSSEVVTIVDPDGTLRYASPALGRVLGYDPEEMLGRNVLEYVHPDDLPHVKGKTEEALGQPGVARNRAEYRFLHKDGTWRDIEATGSYLIDDPAVRGVVVVSRDVTERKEAEKALRESRDLLRVVLEGTDDAVYVKNADGRYLMINPAGAGLIGKEPDGVVGEDDTALFAAADARRMMERDREIMASGETLVYEETREADGVARTYLTTKGPYRDRRGEAVGVFGVSRDITESKRAEERLKESEARYRALMEQSVETIYVYDAETKRVLESNVAFQEMIGYTAEELLGMKVYDFIAHEREDVDRRIDRSLELGGRQLGERDYRRKDGSLLVVQTSSSVMPYGGKTAICAVSRDVTELKVAREELEASERRFRSMIQNAPDAISVLDADSTVLYDSPAIERLLGYAPEERIGEKGLDYVHPEDREKASLTLSEVLQNPGVRLPVEYRLRHKDGTWRHFEAARTNLLSDPAVGGIVLNYRDVTGRKRAEKELRRSEERHRRRAWELVLLHRVRSAISAATDLRETLKRVVEAVAETYGYTLVSAYLLRGEGDDRELILQHQVGYDSVLSRIHLSRGVMARVARTGRSALLEDAHSDPEFLGAMPGIVSEVCVPLSVGGEVAGTLNIESTEGEELTADDLRLMEEVGHHVGAAVGRARLHERVREAELRYRNIVEEVPAITYVFSQKPGEHSTPRYISPQLEEILGYTPEEYTADPEFWLKIAHPDDRERLLAADSKTGETGETFREEYRMIATDGRVAWFREEGRLARTEEDGTQLWHGVMYDISELKRVEQELRESEGRLRAVAAGAPVILFAVDREGVFTFEGGAGLEELGLVAGTSVGRSVFEAYSAFPRVISNVRRALSGEEVTDTVEISDRAYHTTYSPQLDDGGNVSGVVGVAADVTERRRLEKELVHRALHDPLTGLPNRRLLLDRLSRALKSRRRRGKSVALLFLDLDGFKAVNDTLGHEAGDELLVTAGERLARIVRPQDTVARMGGDEFCVLLEGAGRAEAARIAERAVSALVAPFSVVGTSRALEDGEVRVSASAGIAIGGEAHAAVGPGAEGAELLRKADVAMYHAKEAGKGSCAVYEPRMDSLTLTRLRLRNELAHALGREEFVLRYQPVFSVSSGKAVGLEALLRWRHPERGELVPADFLAEAEDAGLAADIAERTLKEACRFATRLGDVAGVTPSGDVPWVSVNLSPRRLGKPGLPDVVAGALEECGTDPRRLILEITEDAAAEGHAARRAVLNLKELGVGIALDDFGTGHSSLSQLEDLPVDLLKLDRTFVANLAEDERKPALVRGVTDIARALDLSVVAEGVETHAQLAALEGTGCEYAQGYLFSMPLSSAEAVTLLRGDRSLQGPDPGP